MFLLGPHCFSLLSCPYLHEIVLGISNLLDKISSLSHSIVFLYFFALFTREGFLVSPCYSLYIVPNMLCMCARSVAQSCLTLCNPMHCSPPGSSVHGVFQARILEWVAISYSIGSSWSRDWTHVSWVSCIVSQILYHCATWQAMFYLIWRYVSDLCTVHCDDAYLSLPSEEVLMR